MLRASLRDISSFLQASGRTVTAPQWLDRSGLFRIPEDHSNTQQQLWSGASAALNDRLPEAPHLGFGKLEPAKLLAGSAQVRLFFCAVTAAWTSVL